MIRSAGKGAVGPAKTIPKIQTHDQDKYLQSSTKTFISKYKKRI